MGNTRETKEEKEKKEKELAEINQAYDYYYAEASLLSEHCIQKMGTELKAHLAFQLNTFDEKKKKEYKEKFEKSIILINEQLDNLFEKFRLRINKIKSLGLSAFSKEQHFRVEYLYFAQQVQKLYVNHKMTESLFPLPLFAPLKDEIISSLSDEKKELASYRLTNEESEGIENLKKIDDAERKENTLSKYEFALGIATVVAGVVGCLGVFTIFAGLPLLIAGIALCYNAKKPLGNSLLSYSVPTRMKPPLKRHPQLTYQERINKRMNKQKSSTAEIKKEVDCAHGDDAKHSLQIDKKPSPYQLKKLAELSPHINFEDGSTNAVKIKILAHMKDVLHNATFSNEVKLNFLSQYVKFPSTIKPLTPEAESKLTPEEKKSREENKIAFLFNLFPEITQYEKDKLTALSEYINFIRKEESNEGKISYVPINDTEEKLAHLNLLKAKLHDSQLSDAEKLKTLSQYVIFPAKLMIKQKEKKSIEENLKTRLAFLHKLFPAEPSHHPLITEVDLEERRAKIKRFLDKEEKSVDVVIVGREFKKSP